MINFADCKYTVLRSTNWELSTGFIADQTRAGTKKIRGSNTEQPDTYSVELQFPTLEDYHIFEAWYKTVCFKGVYPFVFRDLKYLESDGFQNVYRIVDSPRVSNKGGHVIIVSMNWEEV